MSFKCGVIVVYRIVLSPRRRSVTKCNIYVQVVSIEGYRATAVRTTNAPQCQLGNDVKGQRHGRVDMHRHEHEPGKLHLPTAGSRCLLHHSRRD